MNIRLNAKVISTIPVFIAVNIAAVEYGFLIFLRNQCL